MGQEELYDRILKTLHEVAFDATGWPVAAGLIDVACGVKGNGLVFAGEDPQQGVEVYLAQFCFRGQRREDSSGSISTTTGPGTNVPRA